ncbi:MAG: alpha/beta fold hydrolase [Pseudomonadota bacterium]
MPLIYESGYKAPFLLRNPHVQIVPTLFRKVEGVTYKRERIDTADGDFLDLDWSVIGSERLCIVLHGLEGDSGRPYMRGMVKALNRRGWDALALNFRGCSGEPNRQLRMYHSGETEDLQAVIRHASELRAYSQLALAGFSLGGNAILKYLGEQGDSVAPILKAAATISVPCDLRACSIRLEEFSNSPYLKRFLRMLRSKMETKSLLAPNIVSVAGYDQIRTLKEFDDRYTAPLHGFKDADDYYSQSSSKQFLKTVSIPTLLINSADDPFLSPNCYPAEEAIALL